MNVFELNLVASPVAGLVGGLIAAKEIAAASSAVAGGIGLGVGVGLYFGTFAFCLVAGKITGAATPREWKSLRWLASTTSLLILLPMLVLPILSAITAHWIVGWIYR